MKKTLLSTAALCGFLRTRHRTFYLVKRISPGSNFLIGADYLRRLTDFKGLRRGVDNRVNLFLQYSF